LKREPKNKNDPNAILVVIY
jgi:protein associated with RNAse G/E